MVHVKWETFSLMAAAFRINVYNIIKINVVLLYMGMHMQRTISVFSSYFVSMVHADDVVLAGEWFLFWSDGRTDGSGGGLFIIHILFGF